MTITIYHMDDEIQILDRFEKILSKGLLNRQVKISGFETSVALEAAIAKSSPVDIFILDVYLRDGLDHGTRMTSICRAKFPDSLIFVCSGAKDLKTIRTSLKEGATDFLAKESKPAEIVARIESALKSRVEPLTPKTSSIESKIHAGSTISTVRLRVPQILSSAINCVYVEGESGTGKEVVADCIAAALPKGTPFIKVNCGAISQSLITSELFGYTKGAFTGAATEKSGLIEAADGGWIFLDEIATLPLDAQASLLRAIENQEIRRIGATKDKQVSFRVISATNEPLAKLVDEGKFRKDLWQRLRETEIKLPPLRKRRHEIPELIDHFCASMRGGPYNLAPTVLEVLTHYNWKEGNIRELRNCLRAMTEKSVNRLLTPNSIPEHIWESVDQDVANPERPKLPSLTLTWKGKERPSFDKLADKLLVEILRHEFRANGKMSMRGAAKAAGIPKSTLPAKLKLLVQSEVIDSDELAKMIHTLDDT